MKSLISRLIGYRWLCLLLAVVLYTSAWNLAQQLSFDRRIETMFSRDDPRYRDYQDGHRLFGSAETCIIAYDDPQLFSVAGLTRLQNLSETVAAVPGVAGVISLNIVRRPSAPWDTRPLGQQLQQQAITPGALRDELLASRLYRGRFVSDSGESPILWVELERDDPTSGKRVQAEALQALREIVRQHDPPAVLAGGPVLVDEVFTVLDRDGDTLGWSSTVILTLVILLLFKNLRWVVLPLLVVQLAIVMTKGLLQATGLQLTMVSSPLVALVTVIGVATVVHLTVRYREERHQASAREALQVTLEHLGPAIVWTCVTTLLGFAALQISHVGPVKNFGLMMSIGSAMVLLAVGLLTTPLILFWPRLPDEPGTAWFEGGAARLLDRLVTQVERYPGRVVLALTLLVAWGLVGIFRVEVATDFNENFRSSSPIVQAFEFLKKRIAGINAIDVIIGGAPTDERAIDDRLANLRRLQQELEKDPRVAATMSVIEFLDLVPGGVGENLGSGPPDERRRRSRWLSQLADNLTINISDRTKLAAVERIEPQLIKKFWNREAHALRVIVQVTHAAGSREKLDVVETVERIAQRHFPEARATGIYVLMVYLVQSLLADQWTTFALSIVLIFATMAWALRSPLLAFIAMIPNVAPIVLVIGAMGWWGLKVNMASAMIASVSLGLSVDFSIHYLWRFREEFARCADRFSALRRAHGSVGLSMVLANLALMAGFLVLLTSSLLPTVHFGLLVTVAMFGGLIGNLVVLPLFLRWWYLPARR